MSLHFIVDCFAWILLAAVVWMIFQARYQRQQSENWPVVKGTIRPGEPIVRDSHIRTAGSPACQVTEFDYIYSVAGRSYTGRFALPVYGFEAVDVLKWHQELDGKIVTIRYDPENPAICLLTETELLGRRIYQPPDWLG